MRGRRYATLVSVPLVLFSGCLLPSFQNVDEPASSGGAAGTSGAAGTGASGASPGEQAGEAGSASTAPEPADDVFSMLQGATLSIPAPGVLENDVGASLTVNSIDDTDATRPAKYDAEALSIDANGKLGFKPQQDFFGVYTVAYTVRDKDGATAQASVKIQVQPVAASLATVRDGIGGFVIDGVANDGIGTAISGAGDVNHDGFDDLLLGAPSAGSNGAGRAYVVYGRAKPTAVPLKVLPPKSTERTFFELDGAEGDGAGNSVAAIGDLNGDKVADFAVAASTSGPAGAPVGAVYVLFGGAAWSGSNSLPALPATRSVQFTGSTSAPIGARISRAGDVNGDGTPDLLISGASEEGRVYALLGSSSLASTALDNTPNLLQIQGGGSREALPLSMDFVGRVDTGGVLDAVVMSNFSSVVLLKGAATKYPVRTSSISTDGATGWRYEPMPQGQYTTVAGAGDVNLDAEHSADVVICETQASTGGIGCHVVLDVRNHVDSLGMGWPFTGFTVLPRLAHGADLNGDGFSDLLFGDDSTVYAVFGKKSGFAPVDVTDLADAGFSLTTEASSHIDAVATVGDVNGDGVPDYAVGVSSAKSGAGSVYVVFGVNSN